MVELARQLACAINSPVWSQVRRPAPWEQHPLVNVLAA